MQFLPTWSDIMTSRATSFFATFRIALAAGGLLLATGTAMAADSERQSGASSTIAQERQNCMDGKTNQALRSRKPIVAICVTPAITTKTPASAATRYRRIRRPTVNAGPWAKAVLAAA